MSASSSSTASQAPSSTESPCLADRLKEIFDDSLVQLHCCFRRPPSECEEDLATKHAFFKKAQTLNKLKKEIYVSNLLHEKEPGKYSLGLLGVDPSANSRKKLDCHPLDLEVDLEVTREFYEQLHRIRLEINGEIMPFPTGEKVEKQREVKLERILETLQKSFPDSERLKGTLYRISQVLPGPLGFDLHAQAKDLFTPIRESYPKRNCCDETPMICNQSKAPHVFRLDVCPHAVSITTDCTFIIAFPSSPEKILCRVKGTAVYDAISNRASYAFSPEPTPLQLI